MRVLILPMLAALAACGAETKPDSTRQAPNEASASSSVTASARPSPSSAPSTDRPSLAKKEPEKRTSAIRENVSTGASKDGAAFEARMFVSKLTAGDGVHVAIHFKLDKPAEPNGALAKATMDAGDFLRSLRFIVTSPSGKTTLETSEQVGRGQISLAWFTSELTIDGSGVTKQGRDKAPWKTPAPDIFSKAGKYSVAIQGQLKMTNRTVAIDLKPLEFEIVDPSPAWKTLDELRSAAASFVQDSNGLAKPPVSNVAVVDDVDDGRWFRFQTQPRDEGRSRYEVEIHEVLLDPAGKPKNYDVYTHHTCVAEGTKILTPTGETPIEKLVVGDAVVSYDPVSREKQISLVENVSALHAERLIRLGDLLVTGAHPIFVEGRFEVAADLGPASRLFGSDREIKVVSPVAVDTPATVYDLSVSEPHTYFAGGLLVHNKPAPIAVGGNELPWNGYFYRRAVKQ